MPAYAGTARVAACNARREFFERIRPWAHRGAARGGRGRTAAGRRVRHTTASWRP